jgi:hypothetical protein
MPNKATEQLIEFVRAATSNQPSFKTDTQVVSGGVLLTVLPSLQAEEPVSFRIEFPAEDGLSEHPFPVIMLSALFDLETLIVLGLRGRIVDALKTGKTLEEHPDGRKLTLWRSNGNWVMEIARA